MSLGSFKNVLEKNVFRNHIFKVCIKGIWRWMTYNGWYVIKENRTKPEVHET